MCVTACKFKVFDKIQGSSFSLIKCLKMDVSSSHPCHHLVGLFNISFPCCMMIINSLVLLV